MCLRNTFVELIESLQKSCGFAFRKTKTIQRKRYRKYIFLIYSLKNSMPKEFSLQVCCNSKKTCKFALLK